MKVQATELKQLQSLKNAFVRLTNTDTWEEATTNFPNFATEEQLKKFLSIDVKKKIPQNFVDFCTRAKNTGTSTSASEHSGIAYKTCTAHVVESKTTEVNGQMIKGTCPSFGGAALTIVRIEEVFNTSLDIRKYIIT